MTIERNWFIPCLLLTAGAILFALWHAPAAGDLLPALGILPAWIAGSAVLGMILAFLFMATQGEKSPLSAIARFVRADHLRIVGAGLFMALAGLNLVAFMWIKPLLNVLVPFWADPLLANLDAALFFGHEPWTLLQWLNFPAAGFIYHPLWFLSVMLGLLLAIAAPASPDRSAVLLGYFVLWTLVAPLIHSALPAAGPIFYEAMGYGPRFADMPLNPETAGVADYLWQFYASGSYGAGNGISAMPSMHVTTSAWVVIAVWTGARRWVPLALLAFLTIFGMSIALGWHYALDGVVGTAAALACQLALRALFRARGTSSPEAAPAPA